MIVTSPGRAAAATSLTPALSVPEPFRVERDAQQLTSCWPTHPDDPREDLSWAVGSLQPDDGVAFVAEPAGPAVWTRVVNGPRAQPRKNAVTVCAGARRGVTQNRAVLAAAEAAASRQVVLTANGYCSPVVAPGAVDSRALADVVGVVIDAAHRMGAVAAALHCSAEDPLLAELRRRGFVTGITDFYLDLEVPRGGVEEYLAGFPSARRSKIRKEMARGEGRTRMLRGADTATFIPVAAGLVAAAYARRGQPVDPLVLRAHYEELAAAFDERFLISVADVDGVPVASTCILQGGDALLLYSSGLDADRARAVDGYFNATYYEPLRYAAAAGLGRLLLGPGSIEPKRLRGARVHPRYSAVPASCDPLVALLAATDREMRARLTAYTS
jgi:hypothetical protein